LLVTQNSLFIEVLNNILCSNKYTANNICRMYENASFTKTNYKKFLPWEGGKPRLPHPPPAYNLFKFSSHRNINKIQTLKHAPICLLKKLPCTSTSHMHCVCGFVILTR
jgi:hypothetical protein